MPASPPPLPIVEPRNELAGASVTATEMAVIDRVWRMRGFRSRSEFVRAVLFADIRAASPSDGALLPREAA